MQSFQKVHPHSAAQVNGQPYDSMESGEQTHLYSDVASQVKADRIGELLPDVIGSEGQRDYEVNDCHVRRRKANPMAHIRGRQ